MNTQGLHQHAQDLYKLKLEKNHSMEEGSWHEIPPLAEELLTSDCYWEREKFDLLYLFKCFYNKVYKNNGVTHSR